MLTQSNREIHNSDDVLRDYIDYVHADGSVESFGIEMVIDPKRKEIEDPQVITLTHDEEILARRGLWRHLGIIYRGIKKKTGSADSSGISLRTWEALNLADELRADAAQSVQILNCAFNYEEGVWLPETVRKDPDVAHVLVQTMMAVKTKCPLEVSDQLSLAQRAQAHRGRLIRDDMASLVLDLSRRRAHPALIKTAQAIINYHDPEGKAA